MIQDQIDLGIRDSNTQTELLKVRDLTLEKCVDICRAAENATSQNKLLHPDAVHKVGLRQGTERREVKECKFCGTHHRFRKEDCPAYGKTCLKCNRKNHFQRKCTAVGASVNAATNSKDSRHQLKTQPPPTQKTAATDSKDSRQGVHQVADGTS